MDDPAAGLLAETFGYGHAVLFGRARSAVAALIRELGTSGLPVVLPSNICPEICLAIEASGAVPHMVSVAADTGLPTDAHFAATLRGLPSGIAMPCHLYGIRQDYSECLVAARTGGWFVLENDTLLATARLENASPRLAIGDALLVSFGDSKTIALGGGGALLMDDGTLAAALRHQLRDCPPSGPELAAHEAMVVRQRRMDRGAPIDPDHGSARLWSFPPALNDPLRRALVDLPRSVDRLRSQHRRWSDALAGQQLAASPIPRVPWRWVAGLPRGRDEVVTALRHAGFDAGTNFPPVWWRSARWAPDAAYVQADRWGQRVFNLWLHEADDPLRIGAAAALIERTLANLESSP